MKEQQGISIEIKIDDNIHTFYSDKADERTIWEFTKWVRGLDLDPESTYVLETFVIQEITQRIEGE